MFSDQLIFASIDLWLHLRNFKLMRELEAEYDTRFHIACPRNYVERMLWRRFIDRNPAFVTWIDKLAAKELVRERCAEALTARTLWIGNTPEELPVELLRPGVWVKANHGCGFNHQVKGEAGEVDEIRRKARFWLGKKYGRRHREWGYHAVRPQLFLEENIAVKAGKLWEFSVRVAGGRFLLGSMMCDSKAPNQWVCYLDEHGEPTHGPNDEPGAEPAGPPEGLDFRAAYAEAIRQACLIARDLDYARVDSFWSGSELYAGEITIYPAAGIIAIKHAGVARLVRDGWRLDESFFLRRTDLGRAERRYAQALRRAIRREADQESSFPAISSSG